MAFGFGIHHCLGNRLAEMQIRVLWEETLKLWPEPCVEMVSEPKRVYACILRGYEELRVQINP
ncbi:MAG: cytochrome P450 [Candidatus Reddybacter sp.]